MKVIDAHRTDTALVITIHLDEAALIPDPEQPLAIGDDGAPLDTRALVPDPQACMTTSWGLDVKEEEAFREAALLARGMRPPAPVTVRSLVGRTV